MTSLNSTSHLEASLDQTISHDATYASDSTNSTAQDFITLTKPGVLLLVVYTAAIGLFLAPNSMHPVLALISIFAIALGSAGAGAFNMWYDKDIDRLMARTKRRPIPQNRIAPQDALAFAILLSTSAVFLLFMATNLKAALLLAFSIFFYAYIYTVLLKRHTSMNIVIGGAAGAFPPVIGWMAATNTWGSAEAWLLFLIIFLWTPSHFWALALYRSQDYQTAKVPMLPVTAGVEHTKKQILIYSILLVASSFCIAFAKPVGPIYDTSAFLLGILYLYLSLKIFKDPTPKSSMRLFGYSIFYLFFLFTALLLDAVL